jgi:uncharacterized protein YqjF (DUF2071 family)
MFQSWNHISFLHWRYPAAPIQALLPMGLRIDVFDSSAWLGLTPFVVEGLRPPFLPALPWLSRFPETNLRTYVTGPDGVPGIWFFSLEAARGLAVIAARALYHLPYRWAEMSVDRTGDIVRYKSRRGQGDAAVSTDARVVTGPAVTPGTRELFLTARFRLYAAGAGKLWLADVEHPPWPLREARLLGLSQNLTRATGLDDPSGEPFLLFSPGVQTRIGAPREVEWNYTPRHPSIVAFR